MGSVDREGVTDQPFGPFEVKPSQIAQLGDRFTEFVNELLRVEVAVGGLDGGQLTTTHLVNRADGGVDAGVHRAVATTWIPEGDSAWQFKAGDLAPAACREELKGASEALAVLREGGCYRLVLGKGLTSEQVRRRREALEAEAAACGIEVQTGMFAVLNASDLAAWAGEHPALAVSPLLGGIDYVAQPFSRWSGQYEATGAWVDAPSRTGVIDKIRARVLDSDSLDVHVEGVSGVGKTRVVLEAIRGQDFEPLVAYVYAEDTLPSTLIHHLQTQQRHAILVVDECGARRHEVLANQLQLAAQVTLITIGEPDGHRGLSTIVTVDPLEEEPLRKAVHHSQPSLKVEHASVVVNVSGGNVRLAQLLARQIVEHPNITTSELINSDIIATYVSRAVPTGPQFHACCALALLPTVGFDKELSTELDLLATTAELTPAALRAAARTLTEINLCNDQGRYRSVTPHPLAIYLATLAWKDFYDNILATLVPGGDISIVERLFRRSVDCGEHPVTTRAAERVLAPGGAYEDLDVWNPGGDGVLLRHLAVLAPVVVLDRITTALAPMADDDLREQSAVRHSVRWALEALAWRTTTFRRAADMLLRIAAVSSDLSSTQDATVRGWTDLFATMLPTTATPTAERTGYLRVVARSSDRRHRLVLVLALERALAPHEHTLVSAEVQGGVLVEPRGTPKTWDEAFTYWEAAIDLLAALTLDSDPTIAARATTELVDAIHPFLSADRIRDYLARAIANLPQSVLSATRSKVLHLAGLFDRLTDQSLTSALDVFSALLPTPTPRQTLDYLANTQPWDLGNGELPDRLAQVVAALPAEDRVPELLRVLQPQPAAAREIGSALAVLAPDDDAVQRRLVALATPEPEALIGYLRKRVEDGDGDAFDQLLDSAAAAELGDLHRLWVSVSGPKSDAGQARVLTLIPRLSPADGARGMRGWYADVDPHLLRDVLAGWLSRIQSRDDYAAVIECVAMSLHDRQEWIPSVDPLVVDLVARYSQYGPMKTMSDYEWRQLARRQLDHQPLKLLATLLDIAEADGPNPFDTQEGPELLREAVVAAGPAGWQTVMTRLHAGSWKIRLLARPWMGNATDVETVRAWVAGDLQRARTVAQVTAPGAEQLHPVTRYLLTDFGDDERVSRSLRSTLIPNMILGAESALYAKLIPQVENWEHADDESSKIAAWVRGTLEWITTTHHAALERETRPGQRVFITESTSRQR